MRYLKKPFYRSYPVRLRDRTEMSEEGRGSSVTAGDGVLDDPKTTDIMVTTLR